MAADLVTNGDFEGGTTGWSASGTASIAQSTTQVYRGAHSLRVTNAAANDGAVYVRTSGLLPSTIYTFRSRVYLDSTEQIAIGWNEYTSADGYIATRQNQPTITGAGWAEIVHQARTDATAAKFDYFCSIRNTGVDFYLDEVSVDVRVAFGAATESVRTLTTDPYTFNHTPAGTPRAIVLAAVHGTSSTDHISSVTYGGVSMTRIVRATDTATEPGAAELWFLGSGIPTGTQTVSVDLTSATGDDFHFVILDFEGDEDMEVVDFDSVNENATNPSVTLQYPDDRTCIAVAALYGGGADGSAFTPSTGNETVHDHDLGAFYSEVIRQTRASTGGTWAIGGTSAADDVAFVALALAEKQRSLIFNPAPLSHLYAR